MEKIRVCVVGYGNVGKEAAVCVRQAPDMELGGVIHSHPIHQDIGCPVGSKITDLKSFGKVDAAVLAVPSRIVPILAPSYLEQGINTVDCFDIHGDGVLGLRTKLGNCAEANKSVSIISAGWDPGTDSVIRILFQAMTPRGLTYTDYGPGMSMGHTVAAKAIPGVKAALSMTIPKGSGHHRRDVYVELDETAVFCDVSEAIKSDPYFVNDETHVTQVPDISEVRSMGHGVFLSRRGSSGTAQNQRLELKLSVANPSVTAQIMVSAVRASFKLSPGAYTLPEVPPIYLLPGDEDDLIRRLV